MVVDNEQLLVSSQLQQGDADRFVDWMYQLTDGLMKQVGLSEQLASEAIQFVTTHVQEEWGGSRVYIHSRHQELVVASRQRLRLQVQALSRQGLSTPMIAERLGVHVTTVNRIMKPGSGVRQSKASLA
jgi:hypothetical protein